MDRIYLDNAATTAVSQPVMEAMLPYYMQVYGNPSSIHSTGRDAKKAVERARRQVASALGCSAQEIYFTAGGSESDNWALKGAAFAHQEKGKHIITTQIEHHAILHTCQWLEAQGWQVTYLPVDADGFVTAQQVENALRPDTVLVSVMAANNEIGTLEPVAEIGALCHERGVLFHTDAVQAVGAIPLDVEALHADMLSLSAHKFHGPKGIGALYIRKGVKIDPLIHGGAQERGKRAGTENIPGIIDLQIAKLNDRLADQQIRCELTPEAKAAIVDAAYDPQYGARPLRRYVQHTVETMLSKRLLRGDVTPGQTVTVDAENGELVMK